MNQKSYLSNRFDSDGTNRSKASTVGLRPNVARWIPLFIVNYRCPIYENRKRNGIS